MPDDRVTKRYLSLYNDGTSVTWQYSADKVSWTNLLNRTFADLSSNGGFDPANMSLFISAISYGPDATPGQAVLGQVYLQGGTTPAQRMLNVVAEGDSITANLPQNGFDDSWLIQTQNELNGLGYTGWFNQAYGGETLTQMNTQYASVESCFTTDPAKLNALLVYAGVNDLQAGASAQQAYDRLKTLVNHYAALTPNGRNVVVQVSTIFTSRYPNGGYNLAEFNTRRRAYNNLIRQGSNDGTLHATVVVDYETHPIMGGEFGPDNHEYFREFASDGVSPDSIHPTSPKGFGEMKNFQVRGLPYLRAATRKVIT